MDTEKLLAKIKNTNFLKQATKDEYIKRIKDFIQEEKRNLKYCLENPAWVINLLLHYVNTERYGIHSADKITSSFIAIFTYNQDLKENENKLYLMWQDQTKRIKDIINKKYESNAPTKRQEKSYVSYEDIIHKRNELEYGSQERLLLSMYTEIPPVRNDYHKIRIYAKKPKYDVNNYIIRDEENDGMFIILNDFKTDKIYKQIKIDIPKILKDEINFSLKKEKRDFLFTSSRDNEPFNSKNTFNRFANRTLKSLFNNNMSLTTLRHVYISRRDLKLEEKSGAERKELANIMGHSLAQQQKYLWHSWLKETNQG
jgi:hypothetical protein